MRLQDETKRLIDLFEAGGIADDFFKRISVKIEEGNPLLYDEKFFESVDDLVVEMEREEERR